MQGIGLGEGVANDSNRLPSGSSCEDCIFFLLIRRYNRSCEGEASNALLGLTWIKRTGIGAADGCRSVLQRSRKARANARSRSRCQSSSRSSHWRSSKRRRSSLRAIDRHCSKPSPQPLA